MNPTELQAVTAAVVDPDLIAMFDDVFSDYRDTHVAGPPGDRIVRDRELWHRLNSLGLVRLTGLEQSGGSGAGWREATELLNAAVRYGVRIPLAEHDLLACWLLEASDQAVDDAVRTVSMTTAAGRALVPTPWASDADRVVVVWQDGERFQLSDLDVASLNVSPGVNLIGEPRDFVVVDAASVAGVVVPAALISELKRKSALVRAVQVCAALDRTVELSIQHSASRVQFGRPLTKFQTIQNLISDAAAEAALARAATESALNTAIESNWRSAHLDFQIAVARSCAGHAASVVTRNTHQVHGAIGTTHEHHLHHFTRAALAWRSEFGSVRYWDDRVAEAAAGAGPKGLWALIAD